ncbi:NAD(P)-binding protein [Denitrobaculum tricleocarpae]|uniref:FAD-dependent oxidoreductase n=1 Tax=Denitrobaculum tricleocarpae TaxID=2591009 RepID=A0A545U2I3_9PROT|nr:NAD(P)-binding protein [Denitrobaculum tricleocarpae]TQV83695.1 FAD-dependent oxidoreductase [Denitrobaculum tricleocarpae]
MSKELPFAITLDPGTSLANETGSWRTEKPVYVDRLPPCNNACPAGENIQAWLFHAEEGDYEQAWQVLMADNPLPGVMGRVCYHPCETACNRAQLDEAVGIHAIERFLGRRAWEQKWKPRFDAEPSGKRVLVVGAGPSGLSAAYHLTRLGHTVTIREAGPMAGGMMRFGIPKYRLPRDVLDYEIQRILDMGVTLELNTKVEDIEAAFTSEGFDAVFVAVGAHLAKRINIPGYAAGKILDAVSVLRDIETGAEPPQLGRRVVVYGGGNTAMDVARTAKRLGVEESMIVYRRSRKEMPAHDFEATEAEEEGVMIHWLRTIKQIDETGFQVEKMAIDEHGRPQPTGEFETIEADTLILALGQDVDTSFLGEVPGVEIARDGVVEVDGHMMTGRAGLFAGGDMVPAERTVTVAVGHGKKAARNIDAWLSGGKYRPGEKHELAAFDKLNTWYYTDAPQTQQPQLELVRRQSGFDEVLQGLTEDNALYEARRCLSCGNCFECDNCYGICPDNAVTKLGPGKRFAFNYDYCKGCGMCAAECPCGAITMVPEAV